MKPNLPRLGARYGKLIPAIRDSLSATDGSAFATAKTQGKDSKLIINGQEITLQPDDFFVETTSIEGYSGAESGGFLVALETKLTPELEQEGLVRELIRTVQDARKQAALDVSDRISLCITGSEEIEAAIEAHRDWIMAETLAGKWTADESGVSFSINRNFDQHDWRIGLKKL